MEIGWEEILVGDHQASGLVGSMVNNAQGQVRAMKDALESRCGRDTDGERQVPPWMVRHTVPVINRGRKGEEGFSGYARWKGREFAKPAAALGVRVLRQCCVHQRCQRAKTSLTSDGRRECGYNVAWGAASH